MPTPNVYMLPCPPTSYQLPHAPLTFSCSGTVPHDACTQSWYSLPPRTNDTRSANARRARYECRFIAEGRLSRALTGHERMCNEQVHLWSCSNSPDLLGAGVEHEVQLDPRAHAHGLAPLLHLALHQHLNPPGHDRRRAVSAPDPSASHPARSSGASDSVCGLSLVGVLWWWCPVVVEAESEWSPSCWSGLVWWRW